LRHDEEWESCMRVVMIVSTGFFEDVRVTKAATSIAGFRGVEDVTVLCMKRKVVGAARPELRLPANLTVSEYGPPSNPWHDSRLRKLFTRIGFLVWALTRVVRLTGRGDVVHCHDLDTAIVGLLASPIRRRFVFDAHEVYPGRSGVSGLRQTVLNWMQLRVLGQADCVVSVSAAAAEYYASLVTATPVVIVTNSRSRVEIVSEDRSRKPDHLVRAIYIGGFTADRGLEQMIQAMAYTNGNYSLDLIGFGPLKARLEELATIQGVNGRGGRVRVLPAIPVTDFISTASRYHVGLVLTEPSCLNHELTVSNKLFDYAAAGLPMLLSRVSEHRRLHSQFSVGLLTDVVPERIAQALTLMATSPGMLERCSEESRRLAEARCWEREIEGYVAAYSADGPGKPSAA
jgi:glycosyltransferase involved in cell wall biosynthesis